MSDVDDELLALAGGDVSSDEEERSIVSRGESESPAPPKRSAKGTTKRTPVKKTKRRATPGDSEEEEGEASDAPSSPSSQQSAPMDESDSDADVAPSGSYDEENKYPVEGLYASLAEKEEISKMREFEREQIIADRVQEKERIHQNRLLRQLVSNDEQRKKRTASAAGLEDGQRKTSRVRTKVGGTKVGETNSALDTLRNRRAEKNERVRRREEDRERRRDRSPSYKDDYEEGDESEVEWATSKSKARSHSPAAKDIPMATLEDVERVRLSRSRFGQVCFYPGFAKAITGCFVRISIGANDAGEPQYRMAIIKGFTTGKAYAIPGLQGQQLVTDQYCIAAHGKSSREWPFIACSDSPFTEQEWSRYQKVCQGEGVALPKRPALLNKADDINSLIKRDWNEHELADKLRRQSELRNKFDGTERKRLEKELERAKNLGQEAKVAQLQEQLDNLETPRLAFRTSLTPAKKNGAESSTPSQQERLAQLNAENRRRNAEAVRKAQLKERAKAREIEKKLERGEAVEEDTSRRLRTKAKFVHDINDTGEKKPGGSQTASGASTPANGAGTPKLGAQKSSSSSLLPHLAKLQQQKAVDKNGIPTIHKPLMDDDIIGALDLDIDEDILV